MCLFGYKSGVGGGCMQLASRSRHLFVVTAGASIRQHVNDAMQQAL